MRWRCFFCDFETDSHEEAAAHFGDRDDPEEFKPICKWWQRMSVEDRVAEFQVLIQELNGEREENGRLREELRKIADAQGSVTEQSQQKSRQDGEA